MIVARLWQFTLAVVVVVSTLVLGQEDHHVTFSSFSEDGSTDLTTPCSEVDVDGNETCGGNVTYVSVDVTTVEADNVTQEEMNVTATGTSTVGKERKGKSEGEEKLLSCSCNLQVYSCDINCCCDPDCTAIDKLSFSRCITDPNIMVDTRFCKYSVHVYKNNTPYVWEVDQNGLFCVVKSNVATPSTFHKETKIANVDEAKVEKRKSYSWKSVRTKQELSFVAGVEMKHGSQVWLVRNGLLEKFELPEAFLTGACLKTTPMKYLSKFSSKCVYQFDELDEHMSLTKLVGNVTFVSNPKLVNISRNQNYLKNCTTRVCVEPEVWLCDGNLDGCLNISKNFTKYEPTCTVSFSDYEKSCGNLVGGMRYVVHHDGVNGIKKVEVLVSLRNVTFDLGSYELFVKDFHVDYVWANRRSNYTSSRSGNPGYITGKPILSGWLKTYNETAGNTTVTKQRIERNVLGLTDDFVVFASNVGGDCVFSNATSSVVEFGFNSIMTCGVRRRVKIAKTASKTCGEVQKVLFSYWGLSRLNTTLSKVIGRFGNANSSNLNDWLEVYVQPSPEFVLNGTKGDYLQGNATFQCQNVYTTLAVDVIHAREVVGDLHHQEKISWVTYTFQDKGNYTFEVVPGGEIQVSLNVVVEIMFYDVTKKKVTKYPEPPSFDIKLPFDFFYPFVKMENVSSRNGGGLILIVLCLLIRF